MKIEDLFTPVNGIATTGLAILPSPKESTVAFIRPASSMGRTIAGFITRDSVKPKLIFPAGTLFVSTNGEGSHSYSYVSDFEFVPNSDITVLLPKKPMTIPEKLFYATCITKNRFKFSYGRKPKGKRLMQLEIPAKIPHWVSMSSNSYSFDKALENIANLSSILTTNKSSTIGKDECRLDIVFEVTYGSNLELNALEKDPMGINFVSRSSRNNGVSAKVKRIDGVEPISGSVLSVAASGSVLETFIQIEPFYSGRDLFYLTPKIKLSAEELLFYCVCIRENRFRYSYGRQANRTLREILIPSPESIPSWVYGTLSKVSKEYQNKINKPLSARA